jgi:nucleotide-binding universal stress UspA family protein
MILLKNILVATDFGDASEAALAYGRDLARSYDATLHVLHAADNVLDRYAGETSAFVLPDVQVQMEATARERVRALLTEEDRRLLRAKAVVVTSLSPAETITEYAKACAIDLIVMGTHGRRGFEHVLMGSVAERVVRCAPCPVLTVRHPERDFITPDALVAVARA